MSNKEIFDTFMVEGGTELAPMSSTAELSVALQYSQGPVGSISTLLWIRTENFMDRSVDLEWLSAFSTRSSSLRSRSHKSNYSSCT
jgi:hypothetical protein